MTEYADADDAEEARTVNRAKAPHLHATIWTKATGHTKRARGFGAVITITDTRTGETRRFHYRGGADRETLASATFRGAADCLDLLATLGFSGAGVTLFTDNPNLLQAIGGFGHRWRERGWRTAGGEPTQNAELIGRVLDHMDARFAVEAAYALPEKTQELRIAEVLALTGRVTPPEARLEELISRPLPALPVAA